MWTGTSALQDIDQTLQTIRNDVVRLDDQIAQLTNSLAEKQRYRVKIINNIASVRLAELESGSLRDDLTAADRQAEEILSQRETALAALNAEIEQINNQISDAEKRREELLIEVNNVSQKIVDGETQVQNQLKVDKAYLTQLEKARAAESVAEEANAKADKAQDNMAEKAKPYQNDPLFMYLWDRSYGTTEYDGGLFSRFMDGWIARVIKYEPARVNYWNLTEIPKRLDEHADSVSNVADEALMALQQIELDALEKTGVKALEAEVESLRKKLDGHDDSIEDLENNLNAKLEERAQFMAGEDNYIKRCLQQLTQALDHQDLFAIHRYVLATNSPTDDQLVLELRSVDDKVADLNDDLKSVRLLQSNKINKLKELQSVRRNFKNSRFDDVRSGFGNKSIIAGMLGQFISGVISSADLWQTIQRNQRYRDVGSLPDFGSGGIGNISISDILGGALGRGTNRLGSRRRTRRTRSPSWYSPSPRGGGFSFPGSGGGSRGGGGFTTGGGF
jgi:chromosome segregation ATPase